MPSTSKYNNWAQENRGSQKSSVHQKKSVKEDFQLKLTELSVTVALNILNYEEEAIEFFTE